MEDAVREAEALAARGHKELVLTGVNIGQYQDGAMGLVDLIRRLEEIQAIDRIRISSIEPTTIPDSLLEVMASSRKLCRYLHIPLQSGDDTILKAMNRRYSVREYIQFIRQAVQKIPDLCVGTDVMVGFPGEGEKEFANTREVIEDLPLAYLHVFSFSDRPGTAAVRMKNHVPVRTIKLRSRELAALSQWKRRTFYQGFMNRTVLVLFERQNDTGLWIGLTDHYVRVGVRSTENLANMMRTVVITGVSDELAVGHLENMEAMGKPTKSVPLVSVV